VNQNAINVDCCSETELNKIRNEKGSASAERVNRRSDVCSIAPLDHYTFSAILGAAEIIKIKKGERTSAFTLVKTLWKIN